MLKENQTGKWKKRFHTLGKKRKCKTRGSLKNKVRFLFGNKMED